MGENRTSLKSKRASEAGSSLGGADKVNVDVPGPGVSIGMMAMTMEDAAVEPGTPPRGKSGARRTCVGLALRYQTNLATESRPTPVSAPSGWVGFPVTSGRSMTHQASGPDKVFICASDMSVISMLSRNLCKRYVSCALIALPWP